MYIYIHIGFNDKSHFMRQIEKHADVYTSRVSNFLRYTPYMYFRSYTNTIAHNRNLDKYREEVRFRSIRQHTSAYVSIRQHTHPSHHCTQPEPRQVPRRGALSQHTSAYVSIRQHTHPSHHCTQPEPRQVPRRGALSHTPAA
jgi:hypothetical protein